VRGLVALSILFGVLATPGAVHALAKFEMQAEGSAFRDTTPVKPVGGNTGTTLGEQRRIAVQAALDIWGKSLESNVPIVAHVTFEALGCGANSAVLAQAQSSEMVSGPNGTPYFVPIALGNAMAGRDLSPGGPDIEVEVNSDIDRACIGPGIVWYYGLDGKAGQAVDLISTLTHEVGHGLGFASWISLSTGRSALGTDNLDAFTAHIYDLTTNRSWLDMSASERVRSAVNPRNVVWNGPLAQAAAKKRLDHGLPTITLTPQVSGFSGLLGDAGAAWNPAFHPASGRLVAASPTTACSALRNDVQGAVALIDISTTRECTWRDAVQRLKDAGAVGVVIVVPVDSGTGGLGLPGGGKTLEIPVVTINSADGTALRRSASTRTVMAALGGNADSYLGADPMGRALLFTPNPLQLGSSVSHFDGIARRDLLMEAYAGPDSIHDLDLTLPVLLDIGWTSACGNGRVDMGEECDDGAANSDAAGSTCHAGCVRPRCGDGTLDSGEDCDEGPANSDAASATCRTSCRRPGCGDGLLDPGELCDQGATNSNVVPNACRTSCMPAHCGDGVVDQGEACDGGGTCSATCTLLSAGTAGPGSVVPGSGIGTATGTLPPGGFAADGGLTPAQGTVPPWQQLTPPAATRKDDGCSVAHASRGRAHSGWALGVMVTLLALRRRRRRQDESECRSLSGFFQGRTRALTRGTRGDRVRAGARTKARFVSHNQPKRSAQ